MVEYFVVGHFVLSFNVSKPQFFFFSLNEDTITWGNGFL